MIRLIALLSMLLAIPALAQTPDPYEKLATDSYSDIDAGVSGLVASGDPRAGTILSALSDGRLFYRPADKALVIKQGATLTDARTGAPSPVDDTLKPVRANTRIRRAIEAAQGPSSTSRGPDAAKRRDAADAVFKARDVAALPALDAALAREQDASVKRARHRGARRGAAFEARHLRGRPARGHPADPGAGRRRCHGRAARALGRSERGGAGGRRPRASRRSRPSSPCSMRSRTSGTACRSAPCFCSRRSGSPSPSA